MWDVERGRGTQRTPPPRPTLSPKPRPSSSPPHVLLSLSLSLSPRQNMTDISSYLLDSRVIFIGSRITDDVSYVFL